MGEKKCSRCEAAVASSLIAGCYTDKGRGEEMRDKYLKGEITLSTLMDNMEENDEYCKNIRILVDEELKDLKNNKFPEVVKQNAQHL